MFGRMPWVVLSVLLLAPRVASASSQGLLRIGVDMAGDHETSWTGGSHTDETETGVFVAFEMPSPTAGTSETGFGIEFQTPRELEDHPGDEFSFISLYVYLRGRTGPSRSSAVLFGRVGYNIFDGNDDYKGTSDLDNGICYAFGVGIPLERGSEVEVAYAVNLGSRDAGATSVDIEYSRISLGVRLAF